MAQLGARLDGIEEAVGSNPIGSTKPSQTANKNVGFWILLPVFSVLLPTAASKYKRLRIIRAKAMLSRSGPHFGCSRDQREHSE